MPNTRQQVVTLVPTSLADHPLPDSSGVIWSGVLACVVACSFPLVNGLVGAGWSIGRSIGYLCLAVLFTLLQVLSDRFSSLLHWLRERPFAFLAVSGAVGLALQSISGDSFVQPIVFTVPLIYAVHMYGPPRTLVVALAYLALMVLGFLASGKQLGMWLVPQAIGYAALMVFMISFAHLSLTQTSARRRADQLAVDLAQQRDYLARLVQITATLTRDLDVIQVLEQVAGAGRTLAQTGQALVWLRADANGDGDDTLQLAAAVPPESRQSMPTSDERQALLATTAEATETRLVLPLLFKGISIGALELRDRPDAPFSDADVALLQPFADAAAVAIENARLYEQARFSATLAERNRIARELHDTIAQGLTAVTMQVEAAQRSFDRDPSRTRARLGRAHELARETLEDVRRSVWTLAAPLIDGHALSQALDELTQRFAARTGLHVSYCHQGPPPTLGHAAATQMLRIVQEALQNVEKHARATTVWVESYVDADGLRVQVHDDGVGFESAGLPLQKPNGNGFGLLSLRERARLAGGTLHIESAPGEGTNVSVTVKTNN